MCSSCWSSPRFACILINGIYFSHLERFILGPARPQTVAWQIAHIFFGWKSCMPTQTQGQIAAWKFGQSSLKSLRQQNAQHQAHRCRNGSNGIAKYLPPFRNRTEFTIGRRCWLLITEHEHESARLARNLRLDSFHLFSERIFPVFPSTTFHH